MLPSQLVLRLCGALLLMLLTALTSLARTVEVRLSVLSMTPPRIKVEAGGIDGTKAWSFRHTYAGMSGLAERIEKLSLTDEHGVEVSVRKLAPGEYETAREAWNVSYEMRLEPPLSSNDTAHVSWLTPERGVFLPGDLLPLAISHALLHLKLPPNWKAATIETQNPEGQFQIGNIDAATILVAPDLRITRHKVSGMEFSSAVSGAWAFTDRDVAEMAGAILKEHAQRIEGVPQKNVMLLLAPLPQTTDAGRWSAETRGGTVLFFSGRAASKAVGLARLSVPLVHELLHLWVPNGLALSGDYSWFYEGFTVYQAMRVSVRLGYLTFQDYLDTLAHTYDNYLALKDQDNLSLIDASSRRWTGNNALVYHKGMLVAAIYDLSVRQQTRGKRTLDSVYRLLHRLHYKAAQEEREGTAAVIGALDEIAGGQDFTERYLKSVNRINLAQILEPYGLTVRKNGMGSQVVVADILTSSQRDLMRQMGYN